VTTFDPMFADYGGLSASQSKRRYHLPDGGEPEVENTETSTGPQEEQITLPVSQLEALREEAFQAGLSQGTAEAQQMHLQEIQAMGARVEGVLSDLAAQVADEMQRMEREAIHLALAIAERMIGYAVEINPEYIIKVVHDALALCGAANIQRIRVSPEDLEFIEVMGVAKGFKEYDGTWSFAPDETIRAGCVVETSAGEIDHRLDAAWDRVKENVIKVLK
jgi:flagellar biosynthesis/type III secretory pathway protein FliH